MAVLGCCNDLINVFVIFSCFLLLILGIVDTYTLGYPS